MEDLRYLAWCRVQPCEFSDHDYVPGRRTFGVLWLHAGGFAHHVIIKGMGCAELRDDYAVPICKDCHDRCHDLAVVVEGRRLPPIPMYAQIIRAERARRRYLAQRDTTATPVCPVPW